MNSKSRKRLKYSQDNLSQALLAIRSKSMSIRQAAKAFVVPKTTLIDKMKNRYVKAGNTGAPTILTALEEQVLVSWIIEMGERGLPVTKCQLLESVAKLVHNLNRENSFKGGIPGNKWYQGFLKRHPEISKRVPQNLTVSRASLSENDIRNWFSSVRSYLTDNDLLDVLTDPKRVFNCDESGFYLSPKEKQVLVRKGSKKVYNRTVNDEKENITVLLTVSADGVMQPPMTLFPYKKRIPSSIHKKYPKSWGIGHSESGWMTGETFYEYMTNVFHPWILNNNIPLPVLFFLDGHASHINLHLSQFCKENGIILTAFYPNATHCLQPLDVGVFHPIKNKWRTKVRQWRMDHNGERLKREDFANILEETLSLAVTPIIVKNAFRACGIFPFDENNIDYGKLIKEPDVCQSHNQSTIETQLEDEKVGMTNSQLLIEVEKRLESDVLFQFRNTIGNWEGDLTQKALFEFWNSLKPVHEQTTFPDSNINDLEEVVFLENNSSIEAEIGPDGGLYVLNNDESSFTNLPTESHDIEKTPPRNISIASNPSASKYPTPFRTALYWPVEHKKTTESVQTRKKKNIPTVAINAEFIEHQKRLEEEKKQKEEKKMNKVLRAPKNVLQQKAKSKRKNEQTNSKNLHPLDTNAESNPDLSVTIAGYTPEDFVIVKYEGEYFPGKILEIYPGSIKVKTMTMSGRNWKWPQRDDILTYEMNDVVAKISSPTAVNNRGVYSVDEISDLHSKSLN